MAEPEVKQKEGNIPWKPIIIIGSVVSGIALVMWLVEKWLIAPSEENKKRAMVIYNDYMTELSELEAYVEQINAGGRTPTDSETKVLDAMMSAMSLKEIEIKTLSESTFEQLADLIKTCGWAALVLIFAPIAGYMTFRLVKAWLDNKKPPPSGGFTCPNCSETFSTQSALKRHMEEEHPPTTVNVAQAQAEFQKLGAWSYGAVAVESGLYDRINRSWRTLSLSELGDIAWGAASAYTLGAAGATELSLLRMLPLLLLA